MSKVQRCPADIRSGWVLGRFFLLVFVLAPSAGTLRPSASHASWSGARALQAGGLRHGRLLYSARGWRHWGWSSSRGLLRIDASAQTDNVGASDTAPFQPGRLSNYYIEARIRAVRDRHKGDDPTVVFAGFGVFAGGTDIRLGGFPVGGIYGVFSGFLDLPSTSGPYQCSWAPAVPCSAYGAARMSAPGRAFSSSFKPGSSWHTYDMHVDGSRYSLTIDGRVDGPSFAIPGYRHNPWIGLWTSYYSIEVKSFKVYAATGGAPAATNVSRLQKVGPVWAAICCKPIQAPLFLGPDSYAAARSLPASEVRSEGEVVSYVAVKGGNPATSQLPNYARGVFATAVAETLFKSSNGAEWGRERDVRADEALAAGGGGELDGLGAIGQQRTSMTFSTVLKPLGGPIPSLVDILDFVRSRYAVHIALFGHPGQVDPAEEAAMLKYLGGEVDRRIQAAESTSGRRARLERMPTTLTSL